MCFFRPKLQHYSPQSMQIVTLPLADIDQIVALTEEVPEFSQPYPAEVYQQRMSGVSHIILGMKIGDQLAGCKLGYQRENDGSFYSWIGCVHPDFRRMGIAQKLADEMEAWAKDQAYKSIRFKTRNRLKAMLQFAIGNGFSIIRVDPKPTLDGVRLHKFCRHHQRSMTPPGPCRYRGLHL